MYIYSVSEEFITIILGFIFTINIKIYAYRVQCVWCTMQTSIGTHSLFQSYYFRDITFLLYKHFHYGSPLDLQI